MCYIKWDQKFRVIWRCKVARVTTQVFRVTNQVVRVTTQVFRVVNQVVRVTNQVARVTTQVARVTTNCWWLFRVRRVVGGRVKQWFELSREIFLWVTEYEVKEVYQTSNPRLPDIKNFLTIILTEMYADQFTSTLNLVEVILRIRRDCMRSKLSCTWVLRRSLLIPSTLEGSRGPVKCR